MQDTSGLRSRIRGPSGPAGILHGTPCEAGSGTEAGV